MPRPFGYACMRRISLLLTAVTVAVACSGTTVSAPADHDVQGSWQRDESGGFTPGSSYALTLNESGGRVTGTGAFTIEAGAPGTLAVNGIVAHDSLRLVIIATFDPTIAPNAKPDTDQFVGTLSSRDRIDGTLTRNGVGDPLALVRAPNVTATSRRHSSRRDSIGSTRLARRAGRYDAARPIAHIARTTAPSVTGSPGETP